MKVLCDANIGSIIARAVAMAGHDVVRAIHAVPHASDEAILEFAVPRLLPLLVLDDLRDHMTVIDDRQVRRRPFPKRSNDNG